MGRVRPAPQVEKTLTFRRGSSGMHCLPDVEAELPKYFSRSDLCRIFGASQGTVERWIEKGFFETIVIEFFVPLTQVRRFIRKYPREYSLTAFDQRKIELLLDPPAPQRRRRARLGPRHPTPGKEGRNPKRGPTGS